MLPARAIVFFYFDYLPPVILLLTFFVMQDAAAHANDNLFFHVLKPQFNTAVYKLAYR